MVKSEHVELLANTMATTPKMTQNVAPTVALSVKPSLSYHRTSRSLRLYTTGMLMDVCALEVFRNCFTARTIARPIPRPA